jgi:hypothetical protein
MKVFQRVICVSILLLISACSKDNSKQNIKIDPGKFVATEPSEISDEQIKSKTCSLDTINGKQRSDGGWTTKQGAALALSGWAFAADKKQAAPAVYVELTGPVQTYYAITTQRHMRIDANQFHQVDPALAVGFELNATTEAIEPGVYKIAIIQSLNGAAEQCKTGASLTIN